MKKIVVPVILFISGFGLLVYDVIQGKGSGGFFIIFPFIIGYGLFSFIGTLMMMLSVLIFFFLPFCYVKYQPELERPEHAPEAPASEAKIDEAKKEFGGVVFIGPVPIVFGSSRKMVYFMIVLGLIMALILVFILLIRI